MEQLELLAFLKIAGIGIAACAWLIAVQLIRRKQFSLDASILELAFAAAFASGAIGLSMAGSIPEFQAGGVALGCLTLLHLGLIRYSRHTGDGVTVGHAEPVLLFYRGRIQRDAVRRTELTEDDVMAAVREGRDPSRERSAIVIRDWTELSRSSSPITMHQRHGSGKR